MYRFANTHGTRMKRYFPGLSDPADAPPYCEVCHTEGHESESCDLYKCTECADVHEVGTMPCSQDYECGKCMCRVCECGEPNAHRVPDADTLGCERYHERKESRA